jgi:hypothetical protein
MSIAASHQLPVQKRGGGAVDAFKVFCQKTGSTGTLFHMGELDLDLQPVGKEKFLAQEQEKLGLNTEEEITEEEEEDGDGILEHRPGTTKRRQYYFKKVCFVVYLVNLYFVQ